MRLRTLVVALSLVSAAFAQEITMERSIERRGPQEKEPERKVSAEDRKRAMQMVEGLEGPVHAMDGASQALALTQLARIYSSSDKKKAMEFLDDAFVAVRNAQLEIKDPRQQKVIRSNIQRKIFSAMMQIDPAHVEQISTEADAETLKSLLPMLLNHYEETKEDAKAVDLLERISRDSEMPYAEAIRVMSRMGPDQVSELRQLFSEALNSYDLHTDPSMLMVGSSFTEMIQKFYPQLPKALVMQAIDTVLTKAKVADENKPARSGPRFSMVSSTGAAVQFQSFYEMRLFELASVLQKLDPGKADELLKQNRDAQAFLAKYPDGMQSIMGNDGPKATDSPAANMSIAMASPPAGGRSGAPATMPFNAADMQTLSKAVGEAQDHPDNALAMVPLLSSLNMQVDAYIQIATAAQQKHTDAARTALRKAMEFAPKLDAAQQPRVAANVARIYQRMGDDDSARKALEKAVELVSAVYKQDTDADDPNVAPKWYWPSTAAWRSAMSTATKIDPRWASGLLKGIDDDDIRAMNQLIIASALLQMPTGGTEIMDFHKNGKNSTMMMQEENR